MKYANDAGLTIAATVIVAMLADGTAFSQEMPSGFNAVHRAEMPVDSQAGPVALIHGVLVFDPEDRFPAHLHGGPGLYTMIEGSVVVDGDDSENEYAAGDYYIQTEGQVLAASNPGDGTAEMAVAFVLGEGEELTTFTEEPETSGASAPAPAMIHNLASEPMQPAGSYSVVQVVLGLAAGESTPLHAHPGPALVTVLDGEVSVKMGDQTRVVSAADGWAVDAGDQVAFNNSGSANARLVASYLVPEGSNLVTIGE